jgi:hypothetical protein
MATPYASQRLHAIAGRLRVEGQRGLRLEMNRTLRAGAAPLVTAVRGAARTQLPHSGGLAELEASQPIRVSVLTGARNAGVRISTRTRGSSQTDKGYVRHPVFGEWRPDMPAQQIPQAAGWWTATLTRGSPAVTPLLLAEMNRVGARIQSGY